MGPWSFLRFFPFLIHLYFIMPISLPAVSLKQAKYNSFRGALTDLLPEWHVTIHQLYMAECSDSAALDRTGKHSKQITSYFVSPLNGTFFPCRFILSSLNIMMWVVLLTMSRRWIVLCFIWSRLQLVLFYRLLLQWLRFIYNCPMIYWPRRLLRYLKLFRIAHYQHHFKLFFLW